MLIQTVNPATGLPLARYPLLDAHASNQAVEQAHAAYQVWRKLSFDARKAKFLTLAELLLQRKSTYAKLIATEMGKPVALGEKEIEKCAWVCEYFANEAQSLLAPQPVDIGMTRSMICYEPLGVIFAIMPWNFPFWQLFRFAVPTMMAGNSVLLKHAPIVSGTGQALASLFADAAFPEHTLQSVILDNCGAKRVIEHPHIVGVTLTGSETAGRTVAALAGQNLKKVILELGGNDPYIVLADADLELAAKAIVASRLNNCGQVCIAAKRVIAVAAVHDDLLRHIRAEMQPYVPGDPMDPATTLGPMARSDLRDQLHQQVLASVQQGAGLLSGGVMPATPGFYYPPTLLTAVQPGMPAFDDELFGPVVCITIATDEHMAIALANRSRFGLGACVFTRDLQRGEQIARDQIEAGACYVNAMVSSHPFLPFGGIKHSGFGRELSHAGILEFVNIKSISIK